MLLLQRVKLKKQQAEPPASPQPWFIRGGTSGLCSWLRPPPPGKALQWGQRDTEEQRDGILGGCGADICLPGPRAGALVIPRTIKPWGKRKKKTFCFAGKRLEEFLCRRLYWRCCGFAVTLIMQQWGRAQPLLHFFLSPPLPPTPMPFKIKKQSSAEGQGSRQRGKQLACSPCAASPRGPSHAFVQFCIHLQPHVCAALPILHPGSDPHCNELYIALPSCTVMLLPPPLHTYSIKPIPAAQHPSSSIWQCRPHRRRAQHRGGVLPLPNSTCTPQPPLCLCAPLDKRRISASERPCKVWLQKGSAGSQLAPGFQG